MERAILRILYLGVLVALLLAGCAAEPSRLSAEDRNESLSFEAPEPLPVVTMVAEKRVEVTTSASGDLGEIPERMIVYTGDLAMVVADTDAVQRQIEVLVEEAEGYIASVESYTVSEGVRRTDLSLRVPAETFNSTMDALRKMALEVTRESVSTQDVTEEYVDLTARLRALEAKAARLEELMERAEDTEAVLAVYRELSATQVEIEQTKGRMQYLERQSAMATIHVELTPDELARPLEVAGWRPQGTVKHAIEALIKTFQFLIDALIWLIIWVLPVVVFLGLLIFLFVKLLRLLFGRRKRRQKDVVVEGQPDNEEQNG